MKIVTGYTGSPHITSNDEQGKNQGIFGNGNSILNVGNMFNATLTNANTVTIQDGEGVMQGVHFRIEPGTTEIVNIQNGTDGYNRVDLICARYTKNAITGVEAVNLVVIAGTPTIGTPTAPAYTQGDILGGDTVADFPLWKIVVRDLTPELSRVADIWMTQKEIYSIGTDSRTIAAGAIETVTFNVPKGVWVLHYNARLEIPSASSTTDNVILMEDSSANDIGIFFNSGQLIGFGNMVAFVNGYTESTFEVTFQNGTSRTATLGKFNVMGLRLA